MQCSSPQNLSAKDTTVSFPSLVNFPPNFGKPLNVSVDGLNDTAVNHLRFTWVPLPDTIGITSTGAVFETHGYRTASHEWLLDVQCRALGCLQYCLPASTHFGLDDIPGTFLLSVCTLHISLQRI